MKKYRMVWMLCLILALLCPHMVQAEEFAIEKSGLDVMLIMDYSGSMKTNDSQDIAKGMVKAFVDTVHSADIRVGFVAYNDRILTSTSPHSIQTEREREDLKTLIDQERYTGNTDIGLGLAYGLELLGEEAERKRVIILISDGEPDLTGSNTGRTTGMSRADMDTVAAKCAEDGTQIYSIAFGDYDGNTEALKVISENTSAQMYTAETPEKLIEILYGIFGTNMDYSIQEITDSVFASGIQNIRIGLEDTYPDEMDVLLISYGKIGDVNILYGSQEIRAVNLGNYAVGKITEISQEIREMTIQAETLENQALQIYLISYRSLTPVLEVSNVIHKNEPFRYRLYFRNRDGNQMTDMGLYQNFTYQFSLSTGSEDEKLWESNPEAVFSDGHIQGETFIGQSGNWFFHAYLEDSMGNCVFEPIPVTVENRPPEGMLPEMGMFTVLTRERRYLLDEYFSDPDGDILAYSLESPTEYMDISISGNILTMRPRKAGIQAVTLKISDGESISSYETEIEVTPLWRAYWWLFAILGGCAVIFIFWKVTHRPRQALEQLEADTKKNHFCGRLDAYFTLHPEIEKDIPPLTFQLHKVRENKLTLGLLLKEYSEAVDAMELDNVHLVADTDRRMVLYHTSKCSVMIGNSIACKQIQYSVSFGDVIYITSLDGNYELEIHYIAAFQSESL